jgi:hypothetical protein
MNEKEKNTMNEEFKEPPEREVMEGMEEPFEEEAAEPEGLEPQGFEPPKDEDEEAPIEEKERFVEVDERLVQIKGEIENQLQGLAFEGAMAEDAFEGTSNIQGVGLGTGEDDPGTGLEPGATCLNVYVAESVSVDEVKSVIVDSMGLSAASSDDVPVNVIVSGLIEAQPHTFRIRPAPGGVSVGHYRITAGTLGCLSRGRRAPRNSRLLMLSNNHVLANSNRARFGDSILQPGRADGGHNPRDRVAILERYVPIRFGAGVNYVDCATAWCWPRLVRKELVYLSKGRRRLFRISSRIQSCRRGLYVGKSGRTTQLTAGRITDCTFSGWVGYGGAGRAFFRDQMVIRGVRGDFSRPGDSGSVIWTWDSRRNPVGLLFAGGGGLTIANKMWRVLSALDINLYT